jgi:AraC-like DNA-binding protein
MDRLDACPRPLLDRHGVPDAALVDPDAVLPAHHLGAFAADAARHTGLLDLGLRAGCVGIGSHGRFGSRVARSSTLREALDVFSSEARKEHSRARFRLAPGGRAAWLLCEGLDGTPDATLQVELYVVQMMLETIRLAAGPDWLPREIHLQSEERPGLQRTEPLCRLGLHFGRPATGIPIPPRLLVAPLALWDAGGRQARPLGTIDTTREAPELPHGFVDSLKQLLATYLVEGPPRIEVVARAARCSVRTLQRRLHETGLSYSRLVEEVRLSAAADKIRQTSHKLVDIAFDAGYSDQANFTRAFRRWAGVPPSQFRRQSAGSPRRRVSLGW